MFRVISAVLAFGLLVSSLQPARAQIPPPAPSPEPAVSATPTDAASAVPSAAPLPTASGGPSTALPAPLALEKTRLQLNPGATSTISITGGTPPYAATLGTPPAAPPAADAPIATATAISVADPNAASAIATVSIDPAAQALVVRAAPLPPRGQRPPQGTTIVTVSDAAGQSITASILVGPNAGYVPETIPIALVGNPSQEFTTVQIDAAVRRATGVLPGTGVVVSMPQNVPASLSAGQTLAIPVKVHLDGRGRYVDVDALPSVQIATSQVPAVAARTLFYSDDPENVNADGILFRGTITQANPARLYYYHQALTPGHQIAIVLDTPNGTAQVTVVGHGAGPNPAVFFVGQNATYRYLDDRARGAGIALDIPIGAPVVIGAGTGPLAARDLVAGIFDIAVRGGDPVRLTVLSYAPGVNPRTLLDGAELPSDGYRRRGEYDLSLSTSIALAERLEPSPAPSAIAAVPAPEPTIVVSRSGSGLPNLRPGGRALGGDYGVLHPLALTLGNDTDAAGTLYLYEQPVTGYPVTTSIAFDGDAAPVRLQCVKTRTNRYLVRAFTVPPHATTAVTGSYMTDGGSTYPIVFGLTATPPSPPPLTMTEADGCFPKPVPASAPPAALPSPVPATAATPGT